MDLPIMLVIWLALSAFFMFLVLSYGKEKLEDLGKLRTRTAAEFFVLLLIVAYTAIFMREAMKTASYFWLGIMVFMVVFSISGAFIFRLQVKHLIFRERAHRIMALAEKLLSNGSRD